MSSESGYLGAVAYPDAFAELATTLCASATRYLYILSPQLDHRVFAGDALASAVSDLARHSQQTEVRILVADTRAMVQRGHPLLSLARRLPSKVQIRRLSEHPDWQGQTVVLRDLDGVLFKAGEAREQGCYQPHSRAFNAHHRGLFLDLWRFSEEDPNLRSLSL